MMTGLRNGPLLLDNFKEDDIEERPGGDALHHSHPEAHGVLLCGGGVEHSHAGPGSDDRGEGEGGDVEDYQAPVDLTENTFYSGKYFSGLFFNLIAHKLLANAESDDEFMRSNGQ